jgi:hypothetical protein
MRVMVVNNWAAGATDTDAARMNIIARFFDTLMLENASGALKKKAPADYRRAREIYTRALELNGVVGERRESMKSGGKTGENGGVQKGGKQVAKQNPVGNTKRAPARVGSVFVCYKFNENGCPRQLQGQGCVTPGGQLFAHACNAVKMNGEYCLGNHSKSQHK